MSGRSLERRINPAELQICRAFRVPPSLVCPHYTWWRPTPPLSIDGHAYRRRTRRRNR